MSETLRFDPLAPVCISGDDWPEHGGYGFNAYNEGGWTATLRILQYLDSLVPEQFGKGQEFLVLGSNHEIVTYLRDRLGYGMRQTLTYSDTSEAFQEMWRGEYWPRLIYCPGNETAGGWGWYPDVRSALIDNLSRLREWLWQRKSGFYSHADHEYNLWLPALFSGQLVMYYDDGAGSNLRPHGAALTNPIFADLQGDYTQFSASGYGYGPYNDRATLTTPWHANFNAPWPYSQKVDLDAATIVTTDGPAVPVTILGMPVPIGDMSGEPIGDGRWFARLPGGD